MYHKIKNITFEEKPTQVYYLKMNTYHAKEVQISAGIEFKKLEQPIQLEDYQDIIYAIGYEWNWLDRLIMPDEELDKRVNNPYTEIYLMHKDNRRCGFAEFVKKNDFVEIQYFGLFPEFIGKGLGKFFLNWCIEKAWSYQPEWVQLNTCSLDHESALGVYQSLGFDIEKEITEIRKIVPKN